MKSLTRRTLILGLAASTLSTAYAAHGVALADKRDDHDRVRRQRNRGDIQPLPKVLDRVRTSIDGEIIEIEFEMEDGVPVYEFKYVDRAGRVRKLYVDARSGSILGSGDD
jgi:uncharacterized membrane protein YkoI